MKILFRPILASLALFLCYFPTFCVFAQEHTIDLVVAYKTVNFADRTMRAIAVNNQIPAPTLHFKQGDQVIINVYNQLDQDTAIHWHGILVPWQMDGVEGITQKAIPPGNVFHYRFTLNQSGTYWYHAHAGLQEQQGLYGAFLIDPPQPPNYHYTKDYTIVLSDWSNTYPDQIFSNLKKEGDYYSPRFPLQPSLVRFVRDYSKATSQERKNILEDYKTMQQTRMSIYDISDVAYDAFLLNGQTKAHPWTAPVEVGDIVRLRFISAAASTNYRVKIPGTILQMVHIQGNDVHPYSINHFNITPAETYDALVKIEKNEPYIIYAESADTLGAAYGALITSPNQVIDYDQVAPFPEPLPVTREMMTNMMAGMSSGEHTMQKAPEHEHEMHHPKSAATEDSTKTMHDMSKPDNMTMHSHSNMDMATEPTIHGDTITGPTSPSTEPNLTTGTKYQDLMAAVKTNDPDKPVKIIKMELFGYMDRFIWMINGLPEYKAHPIHIEPGERYRFIFVNNSMMHHPMHLHGHWFILRNGHGAYDPLLHTLDVAPGATVVADVDTDASGQWFFHCHHLYHMIAGMSRVFQYTTIIEVVKGEIKPENEIKQQPYINRPIVRVDELVPIDINLIQHPMAHPSHRTFANFLDVGADPFNNTQQVTFKGLYGSDYNKLELFMNDAEVDEGKIENADIDIFYWRLLNQFWALKGGINYFYRPATSPYWQPGIGLEGLLPYFIDTDIRTYYHNGSIKLDAELSRDTQISNNFFIRAGLRSILATKTVDDAGIGSGLNQMRYTLRPYYRVAPGLALFVEYEHDSGYGAFRNILRSEGDPASQNTVTLGVSLLF